MIQRRSTRGGRPRSLLFEGSRLLHTANLEYLDANYGGVLVVFDRLFGTYVEEREDLPCGYGWVHSLHSHNPLRVEFQQWINLFRDLRRGFPRSRRLD